MCSRPTIPALTENNICYDTNSEKAEMFAQKFAAVSSDENLTDEFKTHREEFESHLESQPAAGDGFADTGVYEEHDDGINRALEMHELLDAFKTFRKKSTIRADRISYKILKQVPRSCQTVLLNFYNVIWNQCLLPSEWKDAIITSLLKPNKSPFDPASYRPVALTSTLQNSGKNGINATTLVDGDEHEIKAWRLTAPDNYNIGPTRAVLYRPLWCSQHSHRPWSAEKADAPYQEHIQTCEKWGPVAPVAEIFLR